MIYDPSIPILSNRWRQHYFLRTEIHRFYGGLQTLPSASASGVFLQMHKYHPIVLLPRCLRHDSVYRSSVLWVAKWRIFTPPLCTVINNPQKQNLVCLMLWYLELCMLMNKPANTLQVAVECYGFHTVYNVKPSVLLVLLTKRQSSINSKAYCSFMAMPAKSYDSILTSFWANDSKCFEGTVVSGSVSEA